MKEMQRSRMLAAILLLTVAQADAALKIGGIVSAGHSRTKELLEEIVKQRSSVLPTQNKMHPEIAYVENNATFAISNTACGHIGQGVSALISPCSGTVHQVLSSLSSSLAVPYINTAADVVDSRKVADATKDLTLVLAPSTIKATADLIRHNKWRDIYFIYDKPDGLDELQQILAELPKESEVEVKGTHEVTSNTSSLNYIGKVEEAAWDVEKHYILAVDVKLAKRIVSHSYIKKRAYVHFIVPRFTVRHFWSGVSVFDQATVTTFQVIDEIEFKQQKSQRGGVSTPKNPEDEHINIAYSGDVEEPYISGEPRLNLPDSDGSEEEEAFLIDAAQLLSEGLQTLSREQPVAAGQIFKELSQIQATTSCYKSPLQQYQQGPIIAEILKKTRFKGSTGEIKFNEYGRRVEYQIDIMELTSDQVMTKSGTWGESNGLKFSNENSRRDQRTRLRQKVKSQLSITTIIERPFLFFKNENETNPHIDNVDGYLKDLILRVMQDIPGRPEFHIHFVKDKTYGYKDTKESGWNGMIGELLRKDADIAFAPLTVTSERAKVVHFSPPFMSSAIGAIAFNSADDMYDIRTPFTFLTPLDWKIWLLFLAAYAVGAVVLLLINWINQAVATPPADPPRCCRHLYNSLWYAFGLFMSEECNNCRPKSVGSRLIACSWWFFILCFLSIYTAQLFVSQPFSVTGGNLPECVRELLYQDKIEYGLIKGSETEEFFVNTQDEEFKAMYKRILSFNSSVIETYAKAIDIVRNNSRFVVFADSNQIRYTSSQNPCNTVQVGKDLRRTQYAIATSKQFPLRSKIDDVISSLRDEGFLAQLEDKWFGQTDCPSTTPIIAPSVAYGSKPKEVVTPLKVHRVLGWFFILAIGLIVAFFITICEVHLKKPKKIRSPEEIAERKAAREAKKNKKSKKEGAEEVETQQLTAHEAPIGNSQVDDGSSSRPPDDATLKKRGLPREMKIDEEYPAIEETHGFKRTELPPIADVEPFTDTDSREIIRSPTSSLQFGVKVPSGAGILSKPLIIKQTKTQPTQRVISPVQMPTVPPAKPPSAPRTPSPAPAGPPLPAATLPSMSPLGSMSPVGMGILPPMNTGPLSRMELQGQPELKSIDRSPAETPGSPPTEIQRIDPILGNLPPPSMMRPTIQNQDSIGYESSEV